MTPESCATLNIMSGASREQEMTRAPAVVNRKRSIGHNAMRATCTQCFLHHDHRKDTDG